MGILEEVTVEFYRVPLTLEFRYDGNDIIGARAKLVLLNIEYEPINIQHVDLNLSAAEKSALVSRIQSRLSSLESVTGWIQVTGTF